MIEINNLTRKKIDSRLLKKVVKIVLKGENKEIGNLSIAFVDKKTIRILNRKYRRKNEPTDVLSFGKIDELGPKEIVICPEMVRKQDLVLVLIHGLLHILGYEHRNKKERQKIEKKQKEYLLKNKN